MAEFPDGALKLRNAHAIQIWASVLCPGSSEAAMANPGGPRTAVVSRLTNQRRAQSRSVTCS
jgi:hypothetical protein